LFLISTTHGSEMTALGAFIKTVEVYKNKNVSQHLWDYGKQLIEGANEIANRLDISEYFEFGGFACSPIYITRNKNKEVSLEFRTLFSQEMINNGVLIPWVSLCYAHQEKELELTLHAIYKSLEVYKKALNGNINDYLVGKSIKPVFRKYN